MTALFLALAAMQIKHFLLDYCLQTRWMLAGKTRYGAPGGLVHAGLHGVASLAILMAIAPPGAAAGLAGLEAVIHYHLDWGKEALGHAETSAQPRGRRYWCLFGADQALHQLTMLAVTFAAFAA